MEHSITYTFASLIGFSKHESNHELQLYNIQAMHRCGEVCDLVGAAGSRPLDLSILCARRAYMFWSASQSPGYWNSAASLWPELSLLLKL